MNLKSLRSAFWANLREQRPDLYAMRRVTSRGGRVVLAAQNAQPCDIRAAWCEFVDAMERSGRIVAKLAQAATL